MSVSKTPTYMPSGDAATDISNSTLSPESPKKRFKAKNPPSVRTKMSPGKENKPTEPLPQSHSSPTLRATARQPMSEQEALQFIVDDFQSAIRDQNWAELGDLIDHYSHRGFHFAISEDKNHPALKKMREESVIQVLKTNSSLSDEQMNVALDLLIMGADWNATDKNGVSVLNILRKNMTNEVLTLITDEYPNFRHLFIDRDGLMIPPKS